MKWSAGFTVNLNWPFLLSKRNKIDLAGAMISFSEGYGGLDLEKKSCVDGYEMKAEKCRWLHICTQFSSNFFELTPYYEAT